MRNKIDSAELDDEGRSDVLHIHGKPSTSELGELMERYFGSKVLWWDAFTERDLVDNLSQSEQEDFVLPDGFVEELDEEVATCVDITKRSPSFDDIILIALELVEEFKAKEIQHGNH